MSDLFEIKGLDAWYVQGTNILKGLDMTLGKNSVTGLLGLNGSGKTTLMNVICGLHDGYRTETVRFNDRDVQFRDNEFKRSRYIVFSEDDSLGYLTFDEYIQFVFHTYKKKYDKSEADRLVQKFNFEGYRSAMMNSLSMGNRRKAFLIAGFALKPDLLLLDEPVNGLDFQSTEILYEMISGYREYGSVLFSSHILESVTLTSDNVLILENGRISKTFSKDEITPENIRGSLDPEGSED